MALRFMQIFAPDNGDERLTDLLEEHDVLGRWRDDASADECLVMNILIQAEEAEPIMDRLEEIFADSEGFRVVLFPVEAVLPRPKSQQPDEPSNAQEMVEQEAEEATAESQRVSREELYHDVTETLGLNRVFLAMTALSAVVAAVGLIRDDVAVVIGAMVIAPLLGPNVALSLGTTLGDLGLIRKALLTNVVGIVVALAPALFIGMMFTVDYNVPSIANRTHVNLADVVLALAAGCAGTFAFTRGMSGAVIGVMVAVALVPPLVVFGLLLGSGELWFASGALMLTATNVICINLAGVGTFLLQGVRPRTWFEEKRAKTATWTAAVAWAVLLAILTAILVYADVGV